METREASAKILKLLENLLYHCCLSESDSALIDMQCVHENKGSYNSELACSKDAAHFTQLSKQQVEDL